MKALRKIGKTFLAYAPVVQFTGAAAGASVAVYYGPEAEVIIKEAIRHVSF